LKNSCNHWLKIALVCCIGMIPVKVTAHVPYVPVRDSSLQRPYVIPGWSAVMGKSITVQDVHAPRGESSVDVDTVKMTLIEDDFDPALTLNGFIFEEEEECEDNETECHGEEGHEHDTNTSEPVPLVVTENGITGRKLYIKTNVAACRTYASVLPTIAVVGPVQEELPQDTGSLDLPFSLEEGQGIKILENSQQGEVWYDRFTYKSYYGQNSMSLILTKAGDYYVHYWVPDGAWGEIVLELGHIESYGPREILRSLTFNFWQIYDGDISSSTCRDEVEELDGPNPTLSEVLEQLRDEFVPEDNEEEEAP
jgi:hypothetical protein